MPGVRIVTDSACDLDETLVDDHDLTVVPLSIRFGDREFVDRKELSVADFYRTMEASDVLPQTAAPSPGAFETQFRRLLDEGADAIVCINLSAALSATMQAAQTAATAIGETADIRVVDSRSITGGLGELVLDAARQAADGQDADTIVTRVEDLSERTHVYGVLDTLDNLKKGGRIGNATALLGSMLSVKPLLDLSSGEVEEAGRQRTRKKAMIWLRDKIAEQGGSITNLTINHGEAPDIDAFLDLLGPHIESVDHRVGKIGAVIGSHGGPRVLGVSYVRRGG